MTTCPKCGAPVPPGAECAMCTPAKSGTHDPTLKVRGAGAGRAAVSELFGSTGGQIRRRIGVNELFGVRGKLTIGRAPNCDICLPHPSVSRTHAVLEKRSEGLFLRDLNSINGVWVGGNRMVGEEPLAVRERVQIGIGPYLFHLADGTIHTLDSSRGVRLEARGLEKVVDLPGGGKRKLLDNISLAVEPGEFVSLLGPSGCGKSTLMDCLNGRRPATGGSLLANGEDFYGHFDNFRQLLGYVPQKDIVHSQLTVSRALYYTARLRLPEDTTQAELDARLEEVLRLMELQPHRDTLIERLSGGQIKRVSLGAELIARPCLLYIDEATSGLDAGTEARMMRLFRRLADEGKSVLCITHNVDNVDLCDLLIVLFAGRLVFFGPPAEGRKYFGVPKVSDFYDRLAEKPPEKWEAEFAGCSLHADFVAARLAARESAPEAEIGMRSRAEPPVLVVPASPALPTAAPASPAVDAVAPAPAPTAGVDASAAPTSAASASAPAAGAQPPVPEPAPTRPFKAGGWSDLGLAPVAAAGADSSSSSSMSKVAVPAENRSSLRLHQFRVLTARYAELIWRDARTLRLMLLQAPIVAAFVLLGFINKPYQDKVLAPRRLNVEEKAALRRVLSRSEEFNRNANAVDPDGSARELMTSLAVEMGGDDGKAVKPLGKILNEDMLRLLVESDGPIKPDKVIVNPRFTYVLLFVLCITILWFGCNNAAREIVKEEAVYSRERAVNLGIFPYLGSKFLMLGVVAAVQTFLMMLSIYGTLELLDITMGWKGPAPMYRLDYLPQYGVLTLLCMTGVALGLLLSACVGSPDRAATLLPYVLVPQIILGGGLLPVTHGPLHVVAVTFSPAYWAFRAVRTGVTTLPAEFPGHADYNDSPWLACAAMAVQTIALLLLTAWFLRMKDVRKA